MRGATKPWARAWHTESSMPAGEVTSGGSYILASSLMHTDCVTLGSALLQTCPFRSYQLRNPAFRDVTGAKLGALTSVDENMCSWNISPPIRPAGKTESKRSLTCHVGVAAQTKE